MRQVGVFKKDGEARQHWGADVEIDVQGIIAELGAKAIHNKSKKARGLGGLVVVKVSQESRA